MDLLINAFHSKEIHYPSEPWSLDQIEKIPHLHPLAKEIRNALSTTNKYRKDINFQNKLNYEHFISLLNNDLVFRLKVTRQYYLLSQLFEKKRAHVPTHYFKKNKKFKNYLLLLKEYDRLSSSTRQQQEKSAQHLEQQRKLYIETCSKHSEQKIHLFHQKQLRIFDKVHSERANKMSRLIQITDDDSFIHLNVYQPNPKNKEWHTKYNEKLAQKEIERVKHVKNDRFFQNKTKQMHAPHEVKVIEILTQANEGKEELAHANSQQTHRIKYSD